MSERKKLLQSLPIVANVLINESYSLLRKKLLLSMTGPSARLVINDYRLRHCTSLFVTRRFRALDYRGECSVLYGEGQYDDLRAALFMTSVLIQRKSHSYARQIKSYQHFFNASGSAARFCRPSRLGTHCRFREEPVRQRRARQSRALSRIRRAYGTRRRNSGH